MRTFADRQRETEECRYNEEDPTLDPLTLLGAKRMLGSPGGKRIAQVTVQELWKQANEPGQGFLPTARLSAPLRVLQALETLGVIERATDDRGRSIRFRLTDKSLTAAVQREKQT